ncbi:MAG: ASKHA domain-containing protein [Pseudomonadota bacterium]|nr:ASKHA domain-containing protein [Pseudomonadota bacterium]
MTDCGGRINLASNEANNHANPLVIFTPSGRRGNIPQGTTVLDAARMLNVDLDSICGGQAKCGRCQISPVFGKFAKDNINSEQNNLSPPSASEFAFAKRRGLKEGRRLGCNAQIFGDVIIEVPEESQIHRQIIRKEAEPFPIEFSPSTKLYSFRVPKPEMEKQKSDFKRLCESLVAQEFPDETDKLFKCDLGLIQKIQKVLREGNWEVTVAVYKNEEIIEIWPGAKARAFGLAVDIGSTTISAQLCDFSTGELVKVSGTMNPQIRFGEDLMSRVSYIMMNPEGLSDMSQLVRDAVNFLSSQLTAEMGTRPDDILELVFVGNPIMQHLFLEINPSELGGAPFALSIDQGITIKAEELGLFVNPAAKAYFLPCIAGHVGADTAAVVLSHNPFLSQEMTLIVDIGTNAEIVLGNEQGVSACSSPTGPAFEGAQISSGQRASVGAIERVRLNHETFEPTFKVIGNENWSNEPEYQKTANNLKISGICGSGIIEVIGEMFIAGIINKDGVINGQLAEKSERIFQDGRTFSYRLYNNITVTQNDVRAIQLAKAALYAGCQLVMDKINVPRVDKILLAGAFGAYIDPKYALILGMLPDCELSKIESVGNAAGTGARIALLDQKSRSEVENLVQKIKKIETAVEPNFQNYFVEAMAIPHKTAPYNELRKAVSLPTTETTFGTTHSEFKRRRQRKHRKD